MLNIMDWTLGENKPNQSQSCGKAKGKMIVNSDFLRRVI
jgi:hypothetical protein